MKHIFKIFILFIGVSLVACFDDPGTDIVWGDKAYIELDRAGQPNPVVNNQYNRLNDGTKYPLNVQVNLMGRPQSEDVTINFEIESGSTAIEGVHYNRLSTGNSIVIPAGQNTATVPFEVIADNIDPDAPGTADDLFIIFNITGGDLPLSKYVRATFNLKTLCPFLRSNFLGAYTANEPGYGMYDVNFTADATDPNTIVADNFWDFGGVVKYLFVVTGTTGSITLPTQDVVMGANTYTVSQNGTTTTNSCGDSFVVPYKVVLKSTGATQDTNTHTFTKQ
jgi:hypothetical protein